MGSVRPWLQMTLSASKAQHDRDAIHTEQDARFREAEFFQPMMQMLVVRVENRISAERPAHECERGIENRNAQRDDRHDEHCGDRRLVRAVQRERRDGEADEISAAIAEVDPGRWKIENEKTKQRPRERKGIAGHGKLAIVNADQSKRHRHEQSQASREAVETVDQIDDIRHGNEPEHGHEIAGRRQVHAPETARIRHLVDAQSHPINQRGRQNLPDELFARAERRKIVPQPEAIHQHTAGQDREPLHRVARLGVKDEQQPERDGQHDRQAAEARDRHFLPLAGLIRLVEADALLRKPDHPWRGQKSDQEAEGEKANGQNHAAPPFTERTAGSTQGGSKAAWKIMKTASLARKVPVERRRVQRSAFIHSSQVRRESSRWARASKVAARGTSIGSQRRRSIHAATSSTRPGANMRA